MSIISEKSGSEVISMTVFPSQSIFEEMDSCPQSLQVSDAIFVITQIPKQRKRILNFSKSIFETFISVFKYSKISESIDKHSMKIIIPEAKTSAKANSGLYCFKTMITAAEIIPIPDINKISFIGQKHFLRYQKDR